MSGDVTKRNTKVGYFRQIDDRVPAYKGTVVSSERKSNGLWVYVKVHGSLARQHVTARPSQLRVVSEVD